MFWICLQNGGFLCGGNPGSIDEDAVLAGGGNPGGGPSGERQEEVGGVQFPVNILGLGSDMLCCLGWRFMGLVWLLVM